MCTHYTLLRNARSKQRSVHVRNSEVRTYDLLRKSVLRSFRMRKARLVVSPKPREARADQERLRRPSGGVRHVAGGWGKAPQPPARSVGVVPGRQGQAAARWPAASLDPHPLRQRPSKPLCGPLARFSSRGRVKGLVRPAAPQGRGHGPLTRPERPNPAGRVSGALFPRHPCPSARGPRQGRRRRFYGLPCRGAPPAGVPRGAQPLGPSAANKKPSAEGRHFLLFELRSSALHGPQKGPKSQRQKGNPGKPRGARVST